MKYKLIPFTLFFLLITLTYYLNSKNHSIIKKNINSESFLDEGTLLNQKSGYGYEYDLINDDIDFSDLEKQLENEQTFRDQLNAINKQANSDLSQSVDSMFEHSFFNNQSKLQLSKKNSKGEVYRN